MALNDIKENLSRDIREPVLRVCMILIEHLSKMPSQELHRLTYRILASVAGTRPDDQIFQAALTALTTIRHNALTLYFVFYDEEDDREVAISAAEAMRSVDEHYFVHPRTGEEVHNFERQLKPVYKASNEFMDALRNR